MLHPDAPLTLVHIVYAIAVQTTPRTRRRSGRGRQVIAGADRCQSASGSRKRESTDHLAEDDGHAPTTRLVRPFTTSGRPRSRSRSQAATTRERDVDAPAESMGTRITRQAGQRQAERG